MSAYILTPDYAAVRAKVLAGNQVDPIDYTKILFVTNSADTKTAIETYVTTASAGAKQIAIE
jgi:hypothetical protein